MMSYDVKKMYAWPFSLRLMVLSLCAILILILIYLFDISPLKSQIVYDNGQVEDLKQQLAMMLDKQVTFSNEISQLPELKTLEKGWQKRVIDKSSFSGLLDTLLKYGESNNLKFTGFGPAGEFKEGMFTKVPVKIEMKGTFDEIATFISQVVNMQSMILVGDYSITREKQSDVQSENMSLLSSDAMLTAELTLLIYRK